MLKDHNGQSSIFALLYSKIPENHILKKINSVISLSFVNEMLESSYSKYYGRPAKEPELMVRLLILKYLYNLSDEQVIEETSLNLAYMWFLGINPDDKLPDPSLLAKFRVHRLKEITIDEIITEVVKQCVDKGILKDTGVSVDSTHTEANTIKKVPERIMKHLAKDILSNLEQEKGQLPSNINNDIPNYKEIENHTQAKELMKSYIDELIEETGKVIDSKKHPSTKKAINKAKRILDDPKFMQQKGARSIVDQEARVGHKSKTDRFFGYKIEYAITTTERIITGIRVYDGAYVDGTGFDELLKLSLDTGLDIKDWFGDKAYFRKHILDLIKEVNGEIYIPVSESVYRLDESTYSYNKDSDQWFCNLGNHTISKKKSTKKDGRQFWKYKFDKKICEECSQKCYKSKAKAKTLQVSVNTPEFYEYSKRAKTQEFKDKYKDRACQEWKNAEIKRFHGLDRAQGYGLRSMSIQSKLTALAVNLKRIAALASSLKGNFYLIIIKRRQEAQFCKDTLEKSA